MKKEPIIEATDEPKKKRGRPKKSEEAKKETIDLKNNESIILEEKIESMTKDLKNEEDELCKSLVASRIHRSILKKIKDLVALNDVAYLMRGNIGKINESEGNLEIFALEKFLNNQLDIFNKKSNGFVFPEVRDFIEKIKKEGKS